MVRGVVFWLEGLSVHGALGPVHEVQVNVFNIKSLEGPLEGLGHTVVVGVIPMEMSVCEWWRRPVYTYSFVVTKISFRGTPDSRMALPTCSSFL